MSPASAAGRPFVDLPAADVDAAGDAARRALAEWGASDNEPVLLRVGMNALFTVGEQVVRVGHATAPAGASHELVAMLRSNSITTVSPEPGWAADVGVWAVTGWRRVTEGGSPTGDDWEHIGAAVRKVHHIDRIAVPETYPVPEPTGFPWWKFDAMLADASADLDDASWQRLREVVDEHSAWAEAVTHEAVLCHGDVHPGNVLVPAAGGAPLLIDWDLLCWANPAWDHAMLASAADRWGISPDVYRSFSSGYGRSFADDDLTQRLGTLRNVAATLLKVRAARHSPPAARELERRLRFWRGDPDAPVWRAQ